MTKLHAWKQAKRVTLREIADGTGLTEGTLSRLINGKLMPGWDTMEAIAKFTGYDVLPNDWAPFLPAPKRRRKAA